jgi:hypothetical protein
MDKVDRLGWAAGVAFSSYGRKIGVRVNDPSALPRIYEVLPPEWTAATSPVVEQLYSLVVGGYGPRPGQRRFSLLYSEADRIYRTLDHASIFDALEQELRLHVAEFASRRIFVHAGVVGWKGKAIVIPGSTHTGKSTLVAAFLRAGAVYYSDEYAVFDARGRVHPFPRPLSMRRDEKQTRVGPEVFGAATGSDPLPVGLVLATRYRAQAQWRPRQLTPGQALLELLANTIAARRAPATALKFLGKAVSSARSLKSARGEADIIVAKVLGQGYVVSP